MALRVNQLTKSVLLLLVVVLMEMMEHVGGARILLVSPQVSSHIMMQTAIGEELVGRGHEVYIAIGSRHSKPESLEKLGLQTLKFHIPSDVPFGLSDDDSASKYLAEKIIFNPTADRFTLRLAATVVIFRDCEFMLTDHKFLQQVRALKFDIALVEPFVIGPCVLLLPHNLNIPFVSLTNFYMPWSIRLPALPSFLRIPSPIDTGSKSTLWNSVVNTMVYITTHWKIPSTFWNNTFLEHHSSGNLTWDQLILKSELFLLSNDYHIGLPYPLFPNVIPVPGVTIRPTKPLPEELETLVVKSRHGIILLTFGSLASHFPGPVVAKFFEAFARVQQTVIARLSSPEGVEVPKNVHLFRWLPQNDILAHQQTKLFITHCGSNGQHEALYHGVPMLGFPLFAEQPENCKRTRAKGLGLCMDILDFTSAELYDNIQEMLNNKSYTDTVKHLSATLRDEPLIGSKKAAHWIEHVIKYGSAHLRSPAMNLPIYRFMMFDVLAVFFVVIFAVTVVTCVSTVAIIRTIRRRLKHHPSQKKEQ